jgi:hypothetical protein
MYLVGVSAHFLGVNYGPMALPHDQIQRPTVHRVAPWTGCHCNFSRRHESAPLRVPGVARSRCVWKYGIRYTIGISNISMYILKKSIFEWVNAVKWLRTYWMLEYWSILEPVFRQSFYDFLVLLWFDHRCYRPGSTLIPIWEPWWSQANLGTSWDIMAENLPPFFSSLLPDLAGATPGDIMTCLDLILDQAGCADLCAICGMVALSTNMY